MTIRELLNLATKKIKSTSPSLDAEVLLSHILDRPKEYLLANQDQTIAAKREKQFKILLARRQNHWPVAYLTNQKEFFGLKFYVDVNVLIPRPETELLVEQVLEKTQGLPATQANLLALQAGQTNLKILDIGTGSGAIIISLAKNLGFPNPRAVKSSLPPSRFPLFFASDISAAALKIAKRNAKSNKVKITFKQGSLLKPWKNEHFDIIVANLPYLAKQTDPSTKHEPKIALIARKKGLAIYEKFFRQIRTFVTIRTFVAIEIGHDQADKIKNLAKKYLPDFQIKIFKDLAGLNRLVVLQAGLTPSETARVRTRV